MKPVRAPYTKPSQRAREQQPARRPTWAPEIKMQAPGLSSLKPINFDDWLNYRKSR